MNIHMQAKQAFPRRLSLAALLPLLGMAGPVGLAQVVSIDMDLGTAGIQDTRVATSGIGFPIGLVLEPGAAGISFYGITVRFDTTELLLDGVPATTTSPPPSLPPPFTDLGTGGESNATGEVTNISAFDPDSAGPTSGQHVIATISFTPTVVTDDGIADVVPALFTPIFDVLWDNAGTDVASSYAFKPGYVVPEPSTTGVVLGLVAGASLLARRRLTKAN